ncbi:gamma-glutamyltransferase family protein [Pontivivens insulae]|uniref:Gamma-glutamyltransferase YwrD n=1 Tax=Pontivivens insulae TaxID=1639689 RepID=A0A2R8A841_9RHOB|nr:gamma-glutamyltransferase family protein [Pontivivens insulae]RED18503.1 gamma-glutamyltransferase 2 [Pontivivens insulae]SPF28401.1 Putative gamma-glutamyltransferase YwrD [Pontivivens insulae]
MRDFHLPGRSPVFATNGMVATSHPLAATVALDTLKRGGNAVDAAIAGAILLGLCEPQMTGLGGDMFALIAEDEKITGLNASGRAPAGIDAQGLRMQGHDAVPAYSVHAVTVPGAVDGFCTLAEQRGKLGIADIIAPLIPYFQNGVPVAPRVADDWAKATHLSGDARDHYLIRGAAPAPGTIFAAPGQARVLDAIAREGHAGFYSGEVADDMVASLNALGGSHTAQDFEDTACNWVEPISGTYRGAELVELPPNGSGATALLIAKILEQFDIAALDPFGAERAHLEAEAAKLAYDARNRFIADASHTTRLDHMLSEETAKALAALIDMDRAAAAPPPLAEQVHKDTVYITVTDRDGMAVSLIYSIFHSFGSGLASSKFGIGFQNRGAGFTLEAGHPNEAGPGKRPMHTIIPAMLRREGRVEMPFGVMGGAYQPNGHARVISNMLDYGMDPQTALDAPRSFGALGPMDLENGYATEVWDTLRNKGHSVQSPETAIGGAQAIRLHPSGVMEGASDPRKDGCALGY